MNQIIISTDFHDNSHHKEKKKISIYTKMEISQRKSRGTGVRIKGHIVKEEKLKYISTKVCEAYL